MSLIPINRAVIGEDLDALREQLGLSTADACWLYGMSMNKWSKTVKQSARMPLNPSLALLARELAANPENCPVPKMPSASQIFGLISEHHKGMDKKRMAIMFGCEASSGYRWLTVGSKISPVLSRLFMVFNAIYSEAAKRSDSKALSMLQTWDRMVEHEATHRGVPTVFSTGRWTPSADARMGRPIFGEDLDELREQLGLSTMDACWLFGMSMTKWAKVINKEGRKPVDSATLALLVRALREHPEACPLPPMVGASDVYDEIKLVQEIDKKRLAIMFGCEASSGYRWITIGSKISPVLSRLFSIFKIRHAKAMKKSIKAARDMQEEWEQLVIKEAEVRGIPRIFQGGRWLSADMMDDDANEKPSKATKAAKDASGSKASGRSRSGPKAGSLAVA